MTFAWCGHLKNLVNRIGHQVMTVGQLKLIQEIVTLSLFAPFSLFSLGEKLTLDSLWAGIRPLGAVFFLFRRAILGG